MNKTGILLGSVVVNVALGAVVLMRPSEPVPAPVKEVPQPKQIIRTKTETVFVPGETEVVTQWAKLDWRVIESEDYVKYIANLRAAGCPEETIRDLIIADVNKLYAAKWKMLHPVEQQWKYWEAESKRDKKDERKSEERRELEKERDELIRSLLDVNPRSEMAKYSWDQERIGRDEKLAFLSEEKHAQVKGLDEKYRDEVRKVMEEGKAANLSKEELSQKVAALRKQHETELAGVLNGSELLEYELRTSGLANKMRNDLAWFEPNEQEFRALYQKLKAAEAQASANGQKLSLEKDLAQLGDMKGVLSPERLADFQQIQDPAYRDALKLAERFELNPEATKLVAQISQASEAEILKAMANPNLSAEEKQALTRAIKDEKKKALSEAMGKRVKRK
ncbi:MAG TPA: hypothetical protein VGH19_02275 [Verrucomicrobiae bacterium]